MKRVLIIFAAAIVILVGCSTSWKSLQAALPDLSGKPDGVYRGEYTVSGTPNKVVLEATVYKGLLTHIEILQHRCSPFGRKAEKITDRIIDRQSLDVDAISGATSSSKGILKAVENALQ